MTTLNVRNETYKRSIMDFSSTPTYSEQIHQVKTFNANGKETLQANTGFIDEQYNEVIRQLLLSEEVWVDNGTATFASLSFCWTPLTTCPVFTYS